jgi:serine/threonine protein kinase
MPGCASGGPTALASLSDDAKTEMLNPLLLRARSRVGSTLREKWRLDVLLGIGGMAAVYAATHRNGSRAAIKLLHPELSLNPQVRSRFLREGYVANSVGHEGAVRVLDDDAAEDGSIYLVTELLDGETLEDRRLRFGGRLDEDEVLCVADQLLDVIAAAHAKGIVHRDVKPENVFLARTGQVKVLDFGIARFREFSPTGSATKTGSTMGTPAYMSPEQARGLWDEVDARSDLWAIGATIFTLLSGHVVHEGRTTNENLLSAMTEAAPPLASVTPSVSPAVAHLVDRALAFEKEKRWPDAGRMQEAVRHAYHDRHGRPITTSPRLSVPETVTNRTLPGSEGAGSPRLPTTGQPVAATGGGSSAVRARVPTAVLVAGGAVTLGIAFVGVVRMAVANRAGPTTVAAPVATHTTTPVVKPPLEASAPALAENSQTVTPPEIAATDLPGAATTKVQQPLHPPPPARNASLPTATPSASAPAAASAPATKANCNPPFTLDSIGVKHWKSECL